MLKTVEKYKYNEMTPVKCKTDWDGTTQIKC